MFTLTIFSPDLPDLGTQIRCAQNRYDAKILPRSTQELLRKITIAGFD